MTQLYKGDFNWYGACYTLYTHALSERGAFNNFCKQIADKVGYNVRRIRKRFINSIYYTIRKEKENE